MSPERKIVANNSVYKNITLLLCAPKASAKILDPHLFQVTHNLYFEARVDAQKLFSNV